MVANPMASMGPSVRGAGRARSSGPKPFGHAWQHDQDQAYQHAWKHAYGPGLLARLAARTGPHTETSSVFCVDRRQERDDRLYGKLMLDGGKDFEIKVI